MPNRLLRYRPTVSRYRTVKNPGVAPFSPMTRRRMARLPKVLPVLAVRPVKYVTVISQKRIALPLNINSSGRLRIPSVARFTSSVMMLRGRNAAARIRLSRRKAAAGARSRRNRGLIHFRHTPSPPFRCAHP